MSYFMVDVEADGPIPGEYSMVCLGVIVVDPLLDRFESCPADDAAVLPPVR